VEVWVLGGVTVELNGGAGVSATNTDLVVQDATISGNTGEGILATGGSTVTVERSTVEANDQAGISLSAATLVLRRSTVASNGFVGIQPGLSLVNSSFTVENSFVVRSAAQGVVVFSTTLGLTKTFRSNTVADNAAGGMDCGGSQGATTVETSLFYDGATSAEINEALCGAPLFSDIPDPDLGDSQDASNNDATQPAFKDTTPPPPFDYHLMPSFCVGGTGTTCTVTEDVDGDLRPSPCTPGADEP
jgi:parallel beta helix pectate lyase-like protein